MKKYKNDILLIIALLFVSFVLYLCTNIFFHKDADYLRVEVDGQEETILDLNTDTEYEIDTQYGKNMIIIDHKKVMMTTADCPDKLCVKQGTIHKNGEAIICLPHKLVVTIISDKNSSDIDAIAE